MDFKKQQEQFDDVKWYDSILEGQDRCGSYEFCPFCNKEETEPCARAEYRFRQAQEQTVAVDEAFEEVVEAVEEIAPAAEEEKTFFPVAVIRLKKKPVE